MPHGAEVLHFTRVTLHLQQGWCTNKANLKNKPASQVKFARPLKSEQQLR
jgi:hypothetical protein